MLVDMWTRYEVEWNFITKLCGSIPADPDLQRKWLDARKPKKAPENARPIEELVAEVAQTVPAPEEGEEEDERLSVFQRVEGGLVMRMSTVRAHFKDCGRVMSSLFYGKPGKAAVGETSERSFAVRVLNGLYYPPEMYWVPILGQSDGKQLMQASGQYDKTIHVRTRQGERNAFKTFEYVENAMMRFEVKVLTPPKGKMVVTEAELSDLLEYGGTHGYGGERGDGEGRYLATFRKIEAKK